MIDPHAAGLLQAVLRRESRSLLQYVGEAFPWPAPEERPALDDLKKIIDEERTATAALGQFLYRQRVPPAYLGSYPQEYTTINYVALDHLLPLVVENQRRAVARLERDLAATTDPAARTQVEKILLLKARHLGALQVLAEAHPESVARPAASPTLK